MVHDGADVPAGRRGLIRCGSSSTSSGWSATPGCCSTATLADRLGLEELVNESVWLGTGRRARRCRAARS